MRLAIVGATGLVGRTMIEVLEEHRIKVDELIPVASARSKGATVTMGERNYSIVTLEEAIEMSPDFALFSAGGSISKVWAPRFAEIGCRVIDNSSAWRMDPDVKLVVPEINGTQVGAEDQIIANPNCSTIQLVMALNPLHRAYKIKRLIVSTYQSFSGTGQKAVDQYEAERDGHPLEEGEMVYPHPIFENCIPHCDVFLDNDYTKEEMKIVNETRKILGDNSLRITATCVRVPVNGGHSESVNVEFNSPFDVDEMKALLTSTEGVVVQDDPDKNLYPMPLLAAMDDNVYVGRIRRDDSIENGLNMWIVSDNLRKGAATNAVQILKMLIGVPVNG